MIFNVINLHQTEQQSDSRSISGILLLAGQEGEMFLASYIEDGILHFKVSCGHQLITFSDPQHRVDTGHLHRSLSSALIGPDLQSHCALIGPILSFG